MVRRSLTVLVLAFFAFLLLSSSAYGLTLTGGTEAQRAYVRQMIAESELDIGWLDAQYQGGIKIRIESSWEPYWELDNVPLVEDGAPLLSVDYFYEVDGELQITSREDPGLGPYLAAVGLFYSNGLVVIKASAQPGLNSRFGQTVGHELGGHADWFRLPKQAMTEWYLKVGYGNPLVWLESPLEAYAEHARLIYWNPAVYFTDDYPRTLLKRLSNAEMRTWRSKFPPFATTTTTFPPTTTTVAPTTTTTLPPTTTTSTVPTTSTTVPKTTTTTIPLQPPAFRDIDPTDRELNAALHWAKNEGYVRGYVDGTFRPYKSLAKRHAVLIMAPAGYAFYPDWAFDYSVATRAEVQPLIEGWLEDRGSEPLLRSQLLRVLYRNR